jgi:hypothetical protein
MKIVRTINGTDYEFELTLEECSRLHKEDQIQWAKNIIENYEECLIDENIYENESLLLSIAEDIEEESMSDNSDIEWRVLERYGVVELLD